MTIFEEFPVLKTIEPKKFPSHVLIIPDGNGRWAQNRKLFIQQGHKKGADVAEKITRDLSEIPYIKIVTLWGFSADNWKRNSAEVHALMIIFGQIIKKILSEFKTTNRKFIHLGRKDRLPKSLLKIIEKTEDETSKNTGQILCLAIDFGGEDQVLRMIEKARTFQSNVQINQDFVDKLKDGNGQIPSADLLIRTSGELRTSDIGWLNGAPTDFYFTKKLFPDITTEDIIEAVIDFSKRERRFGGRK
jgi:undecaprenyl diphosphate synthase